MSHQEKIIGLTPWESLLRLDDLKETVWSKDFRSFEQLVEFRRLSGLTYGRTQVQRWLAHLVAQNKVRMEVGRVKNHTGLMVKAVRYIFVK